MLKNRIVISLLAFVFIAGCSAIPSLDEVLPDNRTKYQKSRTLPNLEVPPDLTTDALDDALAIPDEEDATTLSEFERRKVMREGGQLSDAEMALLDNADEKWLVVQGSSIDVWPKLREFWLGKGFEMDLDDAELGVLETQFKEVSQDGFITHREKFKMFSEEGGTPGKLVLFLSSERQERVSGGGDQYEWIGQESSETQEEQIIDELNLHFYGVSKNTSGSNAATSRRAPRKGVELLDAGEGKEYLSIPEDFIRAWNNIEDAISRAGMYIENRNKETGVYRVIYYGAATEDEEGLLDKLKFWKDDEDDGIPFRVSLTGVGDKTEVVLLDEENQWATGENAGRVLTLLQSQYNRLLR